MTERAEADAVSWHDPELPAHRLDQRTPARLILPGNLQRDGEDRSKPADGPGQVDTVQQIFAAMAFEIDACPARAGPPAHRPCQSREQDVYRRFLAGRIGGRVVYREHVVYRERGAGVQYLRPVLQLTVQLASRNV